MCAFLAYYSHLSLESLLVLVGYHLIGFRVSAAVDVFLQACFTLCDVEFVEYRLQKVDFVLDRSLVACGDFLKAFNDFLFGFVDFSVLYWLNVGSCLLYVLLFLCTLQQGVFLRVHHLTVLSL